MKIVSVNSQSAILKELGLRIKRNRLDMLLPEMTFDPEDYRKLGKERQRVSRKTDIKNNSQWKWGDEE